MTRIARTAVVVLVLATAALVGGCRVAGVPEPSPNEPSSAGLIEEPARFDGAVVTFEGEAIGEAMVRDDYAWLHINDDAYHVRNVEEGAELGGYNTGMAVWLPASLTERIEFYGDYQHEGDIVSATGTFNAACAQHGGEMDIHADGLRVVAQGRVVVDEIRPVKLYWAFGLAVLSAVLWTLDRRWGRLAIGLRRRG